MFERAKNNLEFTRKKLEKAKEEFDNGELTETIHYVWTVFENCINIIKDAKDSKPIYEHKSKINMFSLYYSLGYLKKDYSNIFAVLEKLRIRADFGEYSNAPNLPNEIKIREFLKESISLFKETEELLLKLRGKKKSK
ncbi:MAG: hypothetical protein AABW41_04785 [Nanoarchaeota archaeon]